MSHRNSSGRQHRQDAARREKGQASAKRGGVPALAGQPSVQASAQASAQPSAQPQQRPQQKSQPRPQQRPQQRPHADRRDQRRQAPPQAVPVSKYAELVQEIQDEVCYFLPVDAFRAGTHRYLYHVGNYSPQAVLSMQQFMHEKEETLKGLEQGKMGGDERRSAPVLEAYMAAFASLLPSGFFADTLWQLRNVREGLSQVLYYTELPAFVRGKALFRRLEELYTEPAAITDTIWFRSPVHQQIALQELHAIEACLVSAEERASRFDDKQGIMERITKARLHLAGCRSQVQRSVAGGASPRHPLLESIGLSLDEASMLETEGQLTQEIASLERQLTACSTLLHAGGSDAETTNETVQSAALLHLDQDFVDRWYQTTFPRLRELFPPYALKGIPIAVDVPVPAPAYGDSSASPQRSSMADRHGQIYPLRPSRRWLSPEIALMMEYFPGHAYVEAAVSTWDPSLPLDVRRDVFMDAMALFEIQNLSGLEGVLQPETALLATLQLLIEDHSAALAIQIMLNRLSYSDAAAYFNEHLRLPPDILQAHATGAVVGGDQALARFLFRSRIRDLRRQSRDASRKVSWISFYQSIFEQGTFDPAHLRNP
jgi:hypothetical protein